VTDSTELARELVAVWGELLAVGARVTQVDLYAPREVLAARLAADRRRLRALAERGAA
jgi:hypothetical protein